MELTFSHTLVETVCSRICAIPFIDSSLLQVNGLSQPIHTLYGGAHLFKVGALQKLSDLAKDHFLFWASDPSHLSEILEQQHDLDTPWDLVHRNVVARLERLAIEDFRIDFEDGYGARGEIEEDRDAERTAVAVAHEMSLGALPPSFGIRVKSFQPQTIRRSIRTLDIFLSKLLKTTNGVVPNGFVVTLPKVGHKEQVGALADLLDEIESRLSLPRRVIRLELMVEGPESIVSDLGPNPLKALVGAARGRCRGVHFGTYDYSASLDISAEYQTMDHPVCVHALLAMKTSLYGSRVWLADGATNILPLPVHKESAGALLSEQQRQQNAQHIKRAWQQSFSAIQNSLKLGFYQGWDLHPHQIAVRLVAHYAFFLRYLTDATDRLRNFLEKAAQATASGGVFDDAATGQGLLNFFIRALELNVIDSHQLLSAGITQEELKTRSFMAIVDSRRCEK